MTGGTEEQIHGAVALLARIQYATIATVSEAGEPWNTPVYCAFARDLRLFWSSNPSAQHSDNVRANGRAFVAIYDSTAPWGQGRGVYIQAHARELTARDEIEGARRLLRERLGQTPSPDEHERFSGAGPRRVYEAAPERVWANECSYDDAGDVIIDLRTELSIDTVKQAHLLYRITS